MKRPVPAWAPAVPLVLGAAGAAALWFGGLRTRLTLTAAIALVVLVVGVLGGGALAWWRAARDRANAAEAARDAERARLLDEHARQGAIREAQHRAELERTAHEARTWAQEEARASHRRFLARLDHELKNPVTAIRSAVAAIRVPEAAPGRTTPAQRESLLGSVDAQTARLAGLVGDLRKLAEFETRPIEAERVDTARVIREAVSDIADQLSGSGAPARPFEVTLPEVPWPLPAVRGDEDLLYLAVYNLLSNAVKFSPHGSPIAVRGRDEDGVVVIEVSDSGMGIPEAEQAAVFDELARGVGARGTPGSGIGLSLVRIIAGRHGGTVVLRSREQVGTRVELRLPAAP